MGLLARLHEGPLRRAFCYTGRMTSTPQLPDGWKITKYADGFQITAPTGTKMLVPSVEAAQAFVAEHAAYYAQLPKTA